MSKIIQVLKKYWNDPKERTLVKWVVRLLWFGLGFGLLAVVGLLLWAASTGLPSFEELENPEYDLASIIYDTNGEEYGKYYIENREFVRYENISDNIKNALFSVEDSRYFEHSGIDVRALFRVAFKTILLGQSSAGGGSTLTQQLAKLLFDRPSLANKSALQRGITLLGVKLKEWITAVRLEKRYTKEEIVSMYLSKFDFINGAQGIQSAAEIYFSKDQSELSISEAATLVGMLQNPSRFNPVRFNERTKKRRNTVIGKMYDHDEITKEARDSLLATDLDMSQFDRKTQSEGIAPYFRSELTKWLKALLLQEQYHKPEGGQYDIYRDGLKIYTTLDIRYQKHAEEAVKNHLAKLQKRYWRAWDGMDPIAYEATDDEKATRLESINRRIRDLPLYKNLYKKYFAEIERKAKSEFDLDVKEPTLRRLMQDITYGQTLPNNVKSAYLKVARSPKTQQQWKLFQEALDQKMNEEIDAKVFAYNDEGYEIKTMKRRDSLIYHIRILQSGLLAVEPETGHIKAWVGGADHKYFKYDHVNLRRQVGSTIKPFVYATAIAVQGIPPCQEFEDIQYTIAPGDEGFVVSEEWSPSNANGEFTGNKYNLYHGLLYSKNSISVRILKEMGTVELVRDLLHNVGISKEERWPNGRLVVPKVPSICLGSVDLSLQDMVGGYTTFANDGIYTEPTFVHRIEDKNGKVIYQSSQFQRRAINSTYNAVMVDMLQNNTGGGFGLGLKSKNGGKTGTTNDYADGWFMGITPKLVAGVWVGGDEKWVRFYTLDDGQGFVMARPIYQKFMKAIEEDEDINFNTSADFPEPENDISEIIDCSRYKQKEPEKEQAKREAQKKDLEVFEVEEDMFESEFGDFEVEEELDAVDTSGNN